MHELLLFFERVIQQLPMTFRQSLLKLLYPIIMFFGKIFPSKIAVISNHKQIAPLSSFYQLKAITNVGDTILFESFRGKKVLIVNTASDCGFTKQYEELEQLHLQFKNNLIVLGFPANDFKNQEKENDETIAAFCKKNYGVSFTIFKKSQTVKGSQQNEVYQWLTDSTKNGWCQQAPVWNFSKYLIDEKGVLTHFFTPTVSPLDKSILNAIKN